MPSRLPYTYSRSADQPYAVEMHPLPDAEKAALLHEARAAYRKLFSAITIAKNGSDATRVAGLNGADANTKSIMICTTTTVYGTLDEVAALYVTNDSSIVLDFAESKRLYALEAPSKHAPMRYAGVRWSRWKSPSKLVSDRDLLYGEFMDAFTDQETGRRGWARCTKSVVHACCPESQHPYGPVRAELFCSGMILRETDKYGVLEVSTLVHLDTQGVPAFLAQKVLNSRKKTAQNVNHVLKLVRQMNGDSNEVFADDIADDRACRSCNDHVSKWTRARHCRYCDEILCKKCALISYAATVEGKTTRMCVDCGTGKRPQPGSSASTRQQRSNSRTGASGGIPGPDSTDSGSSRHHNKLSRDHSSRSVDTESLDSLRGEDADAALDLLTQLHIRDSSLSSTKSAETTASSNNSTAGTATAQSPHEPLQRIHPRHRGASIPVHVALKPKPAPMDLSYLNDLVKPKK
ncbi:Zinc finger, ring/fyve/phd-type [Globisporangium polare]